MFIFLLLTSRQWSLNASLVNTSLSSKSDYYEFLMQFCDEPPWFYIIGEHRDVECYLKYILCSLVKSFFLQQLSISYYQILLLTFWFLLLNHHTTCSFFRALLPNPLCTFYSWNMLNGNVNASATPGASVSRVFCQVQSPVFAILILCLCH